MEAAHRTLFNQGLMDILKLYQKKEGDSIYSSFRIALPFKAKPDFSEDIVTFNGSSVTLYVLRFSAPNAVSRLCRPVFACIR